MEKCIKKTAVVIDLETLDTVPTAVITEIGAVAFAPESWEVLSRFGCRVDVPDQLARGRSFSASTLRFHERSGTLGEWRGEKFVAAIDNLCAFLRKWKPAEVWIWGKDFDRPLIENACAGVF